MEHEAVFRFTTLHAPALYRSVFPETESEVNPRSAASVRLEGADTLVLTIQAEDLPALRASLNMWLRLVNVADEMLDTAESR
ncbi:MAG: KEOPS complex subunit Pcc1 [Methanoregulaceae archaeon]